MSELKCSVGVMAYNEQASIADALTSILGQKVSSGRIAELIVVASGCEDRTAAIVTEIARRDRRVRLIEQERREGKASAINLFISKARSDVLIMAGADVVMADGSVDQLLSHFADPQVGMVGGRPTPVNGEATFLGHAVHLQWRLHDRIARDVPKLGEVVAFRNVIPSIPLDTAVDEVSIQALITQLGYQLVYEPRAVLYNRGPATVKDFLRQRRRIYAGHLRVREQQEYQAPTMSAWRVARALAGTGSFATPRSAAFTAGTVLLEAVARALGVWDVATRRPTHVWQVSDTTKQDIADGANAGSQHNVAVFHIVDFHRKQLEVGLRASRQLTRDAAERVRLVLGPGALITVQQSGTIIALLAGDREEAERTARDVVRQFAMTSPGADGAAADLRLACGLVAFSPAEPPFTSPIPVPIFEVSAAPSVAS
jgi:biofilm PGA synthesis N-glycosyltransferase PgaC